MRSRFLSTGTAGEETGPAGGRGRLVGDEEFDRRLAERLGVRGRPGILAIVEVQDPDANLPFGGHQKEVAAPGPIDGPLAFDLAMLLSSEDLFCDRNGRICVLLGAQSGGEGLKKLRAIARRMSSRGPGAAAEELHPTAATGYVRLRSARTLEELLQQAEASLSIAKLSLEIEPLRFSSKFAPGKGAPLAWIGRAWAKAPPPVVLSSQFAATLLLGLGAPFLFYAVMDALGMDITGPVYIGVVIVLVCTATSIWVEGFLALKRTDPPEQAGAPHPVATVIIPAYLPNEAKTIVDTLNAFRRLDYPNLVQVIIAYNSPEPRSPVEDQLDEIAFEELKGGRFLIESIRVAGSTSKAQNVNAVIGRVRGEFVGIYDADHHPLPDSLRRAWRWLSNGWDIVQGRCSIRNGHESWVARMIAVEFEQIYAVSHPGRARLHGFGIFGGSNGFWRTSVLHQTRMRASMLTEDIDSSIRALEAGYKITGDRDLISEELAPTTLQPLLNQRLRWAQGWFQVSLQRILPALASSKVSIKQKAGLLQLLVWRELFPWYSIQVFPILAYWIWVYGWRHIDWVVPIFVATTLYTFSVGPGQIAFAYILSRKASTKRIWFLQYLLVSTFLYAPFKDALSRISQLKEGMRERTWKVTPRLAAQKDRPQLGYPTAAVGALLLAMLLVGQAKAAAVQTGFGFSPTQLQSLIGGEAITIRAARDAAKSNHNAQAADLFAKAIHALPNRRSELLPEYADALNYSGRSGQSVPLYREILISGKGGDAFSTKAKLALALGWSGDHRAAVELYDQLLMKRPGDGGLWLHRSRSLAALGRDGEAIAGLDRAPPASWTTGPLGELASEILLKCARDAAKADDHEASAGLFQRAMQHDPALRETLLADYANQLALLKRASAPPVVRPTRLDSKEAQRQLANSASTTAAKSLAAWTTFLKTYPNDADGITRRAQALSSLHQEGEALQGFKAAYLLTKSDGARKSLVDETLTLARQAAQDDRHLESVSLFESAISVDRARRPEFLREYADQLNFSGRPAEAAPLYLDVLRGNYTTALDHRRAVSALSDAYAAIGRPEDALDGFAALKRALPGDVDIDWAASVFAAREAARTDQNAQSAQLFAAAMAIDPERDGEIRREYADQLHFSKGSDRAIPLYLLVLDDDALKPTDREAALKGLAESYDWTQKPDEAVKTYDALLKMDPDDTGVAWSRVVLMARHAAQTDHNEDSANLFFKAVSIDGGRSQAILREYADQLSFMGRPAGAIPVYEKVLATDLSVADRRAARLGLAQANEWAGRLAQAKELYRALVSSYPDDKLLQWKFLVVSAREAGKQDRNKEAAVLYETAIRLAPERRPLVLKEYADKLTFSGRPKEAAPLYRELLLTAEGPRKVKTRDLRLDLARALVWSGQYAPAIAEYQIVVDIFPRDLDARNSLARAQQWSGRTAEAKTTFQSVLLQDSGNAEALRGLAQVEDWQGHHRIAQAILSKHLAAAPSDLEARQLLSQSQVWLGRPDKAVKELEIGLASGR